MVKIVPCYVFSHTNQVIVGVLAAADALEKEKRISASHSKQLLRLEEAAHAREQERKGMRG